MSRPVRRVRRTGADALDSTDEAERRIAEARATGATMLSLSGLGLSALPEAIGQLTELQTLYLSNNQLTALPAAIGQITRLENLTLSP